MTQSSERLARRVLGLPHHPAFVLFHVMPHYITFDEGEEHAERFFHTHEDVLYAVAQYYEVQVGDCNTGRGHV